MLVLLLAIACAPTDCPRWLDADGDGYGGEAVATCATGAGLADQGGDCDDGDATVFPGAEERCDGLDGDCDGTVDEDAVDAVTRWADADGDGYGSVESIGCTQDGAAVGGDCDDADATVSPAAVEHCDGVDEDCDGTADDDAVDALAGFQDADGDGWGAAEVRACTLPEGTVLVSGDCDDGHAEAHPGATEVCDGLDDDCDGTVDVDATDPLTWYADTDGDGVGDPTVSTMACDAPDGYVADGSDCNDADATHTADCPADCTTLVPYSGDVDFVGADASAEMAEFCTTWNAIDGDLLVDRTVDASLGPLSCLCQVDGSVTFANTTSLLTLDGLQSLEEITGDLEFQQDGARGDYTGLDSLARVGGTFRVDPDSGRLASFDGLYALAEIGTLVPGGALVDFRGLDALTTVGELDVPATITSLDGLQHLTTVDELLVDHAPLSDFSPLTSLTSVGTLSVEGAPLLTDLTGLEGLTTIGDLTLEGDPALVSLDGVEGLTDVTGTLTLRDNPVLTSTAALSGLTVLTGGLSLGGNTALASYDGLANLTAIHDDLDVCDSLEGLGDLASVGGAVIVDGCSTDFTPLTSLRDVGGLTLTDTDVMSGLPHITALTGDVLVENCTGTDTRLEVLPDLTWWYGSLEIDNCPVLAEVGWDELTTVYGQFKFYGDAQLASPQLPALTFMYTLVVEYDASWADFDGFSALDTLYTIYVQDNDQLVDLTGLYGISHMPGDLTFEDDALLSADDVYALVDAIGASNIKGRITIRE